MCIHIYIYINKQKENCGLYLMSAQQQWKKITQIILKVADNSSVDKA